MNAAAPSFVPAHCPPPLPPPLPDEGGVTPADICPRVMAFLIDISFLAGLQGLAALAAGRLFLSGVQLDPRGFFASAAGVFLLLFVAPILMGLSYFTILHAHGGQTLGKLFFGVRVIACDGGELSLGGAFLRAIGYGLSLLPFGAGFLWAVLARGRLAWHDYLAGTRVVRA